MSTTVKAGWLKDNQGNKFAPKTMSSQVINDDGTLLKDSVNERLDEISIQSDWNQNDSTKLDFVKNRPFYEKDPVEVVIAEGTIPAGGMLEASASVQSMKLGETYKVVFDGNTYDNLVCIDVGGINGVGDMSFASYPFAFVVQSGMAMAMAGNNSSSHSIKVINNTSEVVSLDRKYIAEHIDLLAGEKVEGKTYTIDDTSKTAKVGAEVFNDYNSNIATGSYSHVEGSNNIASGDYSHAEGYNANATGMLSHAEGFEVVASGNYSHTEGANTTASGDYSHAEGQHSEATEDWAHAEGFATKATGKYSHAQGDNAIASGIGAHAEGYSTEAIGTYSHAEGYGTKSSSTKQHAQGKYNIEDAEDKYAHIVGNGSSNTARSNAHTLDWDGNAWFQGTVESSGINIGNATMTYDETNKRIVISVQ